VGHKDRLDKKTKIASYDMKTATFQGLEFLLHLRPRLGIREAYRWLERRFLLSKEIEGSARISRRLTS
jgi:hypothetical protein